ncbi:MAG TPA: hypothetical protein DGT21_10820 [Armatimonadetes bacterium]|nr:hypothetical protein [Armatimonadota bacterium]
MNVVPSSTLLVTSISAPWSWMIFLLSASPSPMPVGFVVKNVLNTASMFSGGMPQPVSVTSMVTSPAAPARALMRTQPPSGIASMALRIRLSRTWYTWALSM